MKRGDCKKNKKAQITAFIIIGIIFIVLAGSFFIIKNKDFIFKTEKINNEISPVYSFVEDCIKQTGEDAVYYVGNTGGYIIIPEKSMELGADEGFENVAYYLYEGENHMISKQEIENQISNYMNSFLGFCINDFNSLSELDIVSGNIKTITKIENEKIVFNVDYPLSISKQESVYELDEFKNIEIPIRLGFIYNIAEEIINEEIKEPDGVCVSCLKEIGDKHNVKIRISENPNGILFVIIDDKSQVYGKNYEFYFANKYLPFNIKDEI